MLHKVGATDRATMRDFDARHLFARDLDTSESTVETWEAGAERPSGMALKLLTIVRKHGLQVLA